METAVAAARQHATSGLRSFSHRLAKQFTATNGDAAAARNLVFSPLSIYSTLSLVAAGGQGRTLRELLDVLGAGSSPHILDVNVRAMVEQAIPPPASTPDGRGGARVSYASGLWHDSTRTLKPAYRDVATASFRSVVRAVDFVTKPEDAVTQINSWVAESTNNLIDSIVDNSSVNSSTRLVAANSIYFKGRWESPFHKERTIEDKFYRHDGSIVDAQFMNGYENQFIGVHDGFKVLRMPYTVHSFHLFTGSTVAPRYSMCLLLPDIDDGLPGLMDAVAASPGFLQDHMPVKKVEVSEFRVPRFKLSFSTSVKKALQGLGIQAAFSGEAELPDMLEEEDESREPLILGDVLHKAVIEVDEEGTEAAAVTAFHRFLGWEPPLRLDFVADHPFAFFVVEEVSGAILFAGHVVDPTQDSC